MKHIYFLFFLVIAGCTNTKNIEQHQSSNLTKDCSTLNECSRYLQDLIGLHWERPFGSNNGMEVLLQVHLDQDAYVQEVYVVNTSGFDEFDFAAVEAVKKSSPLKRLKGLPIATYSKYFREFQFRFRPTDLRE